MTTNPSVDNVQLVVLRWPNRGLRICARARPGHLPTSRQPEHIPEQLLLKLDAPPIMFPADWSSDGRYLAYYCTDPKNRNDVSVLPLFDDRKPYPLIQTAFNEWQAQFSPDGKWIALVTASRVPRRSTCRHSRCSLGKSESRPQAARGRNVSRDGKELFYLAPDRKLMTVPVKAGATFEVESPRPLFQTTLDPSAFRQAYAGVGRRQSLPAECANRKRRPAAHRRAQLAGVDERQMRCVGDQRPRALWSG